MKPVLATMKPGLNETAEPTLKMPASGEKLVEAP
jgi:hypothetical protein